jgi:transcription factor C subunit 6
MQVPAVSASGDIQFNSDPSILASVGYDGVEILTDLREGNGYAWNRTRGTLAVYCACGYPRLKCITFPDLVSGLTYSTYSLSFGAVGNDSTVKGFSVSPALLGRGNTILEPEGFVWVSLCTPSCREYATDQQQSLHASCLHAQLAAGSADGSCVTTNTLKPMRGGGKAVMSMSIMCILLPNAAPKPQLHYKIYQLDYNRKTRQYRMLQNFLPKVCHCILRHRLLS